MPKDVLLFLKELGLAFFLAIVGLDSGAEVELFSSMDLF